MRLSELKQLFGVQSGKKQTKKEENVVIVLQSESESEEDDEDDEDHEDDEDEENVVIVLQPEEEEVKSPILKLETEQEIPRLPVQVQESLQLNAGERLVALEKELSLKQNVGLSPRERIGRIEQAIQWSCQKSSPGLMARISSAETQVFY